MNVGKAGRKKTAEAEKVSETQNLSGDDNSRGAGTKKKRAQKTATTLKRQACCIGGVKVSKSLDWGKIIQGGGGSENTDNVHHEQSKRPTQKR